jgi:hypothetical protein
MMMVAVVVATAPTVTTARDVQDPSSERILPTPRRKEKMIGKISFVWEPERRDVPQR